MIINSTNRLNSYTINDVNKETSLTLVGSNSSDFGEVLLTNFIRLANNHCGPNEPLHPILGQTYYNNNTKQLNVYTSTNWHPIVSTPNTDILDIVYIDTIPEYNNGSLSLKDALVNYLPLSGNKKSVSITTSKTNFTDDNEAVSISYVNTVIPAKVKSEYMKRDVGSVDMSGPLTLIPPSRFDNKNIAATVGYVDNCGELQTISYNYTDSADTDTKMTITTYSNIGRVLDNGKVDQSNTFVTINFSTSIHDTLPDKKNKTITLPFAFVPTKADNTKYEMSIICNSKTLHKRVSVSVVSGSQIILRRSEEIGSLSIQGTIFGFRSAQLNGSPVLTNECTLV